MFGWRCCCVASLVVLLKVCVCFPAVMDNSTEELQEEGGANIEMTEEEAELTEEKTHSNLKGRRQTSECHARQPSKEVTTATAVTCAGAINGVTEDAKETASGAEALQNGDGGGGGGGGGEDLSSINAMMSAVMSAAGTINGGERDGEAGSGVTSANSSAGPSPR